MITYIFSLNGSAYKFEHAMRISAGDFIRNTEMGILAEVVDYSKSGQECLLSVAPRIPTIHASQINTIHNIQPIEHRSQAAPEPIDLSGINSAHKVVYEFITMKVAEANKTNVALGKMLEIKDCEIKTLKDKLRYAWVAAAVLLFGHVVIVIKGILLAIENQQ